MRRVRRSSELARVEMMPLIDVVFLLLTFFIYSLMVTVQAEVLPVALSPVGTGEAAQPRELVAITIDAEGDFYFDREPISSEALDQRLEALAAQPRDQRPALYVAMEESLGGDRADEQDAAGGVGNDAAGTETQARGGTVRAGVDRGPLLIRLIGKLRAAGIEDFSFIGDPE